MARALQNPDVASLEAIDERMWNCFMVAGQTMVCPDLENSTELGLPLLLKGM